MEPASSDAVGILGADASRKTSGRSTGLPRQCAHWLAMTLLLNDASIETLQSRFCFGICCVWALGGKGRGAHLIWCGGKLGRSPGLIRPFGRGGRGRNVRPTCLAVRCEAGFSLGKAFFGSR